MTQASQGTAWLTDKAYFLKYLNTQMPYGKYAGVLLTDLPEPYVVWYHQKGFPKGELGRMLGLTYEIKVNGLEPMITELRAQMQRELEGGR